MYQYLLEFDVVVYTRHSTITIFSVENVCAMSGYFVLLHCMSVTCHIKNWWPRGTNSRS